jgi:hypothetical protein
MHNIWKKYYYTTIILIRPLETEGNEDEILWGASSNVIYATKCCLLSLRCRRGSIIKLIKTILPYMNLHPYRWC